MQTTTAEMTDEQKRRRIAALCGFTNLTENGAYGYREDLCGPQKPYTRCSTPDYINSLDAMHEAEDWLIVGSDWEDSYTEALEKTSGCYEWNATARQRADALLLTLGSQ